MRLTRHQEAVLPWALEQKCVTERMLDEVEYPHLGLTNRGNLKQSLKALQRKGYLAHEVSFRTWASDLTAHITLEGWWQPPRQEGDPRYSVKERSDYEEGWGDVVRWVVLEWVSDTELVWVAECSTREHADRVALALSSAAGLPRPLTLDARLARVEDAIQALNSKIQGEGAQ